VSQKRQPAPAPDPTLDDLFRATLREWMRAAGMSQDALAARIGKTQAWVSRYLSGDIQIGTLEEAVRLAAAFGQDLAALLQLTAKPDEVELLTAYRAVAPPDRAMVLGLLRRLKRPARGI
jgi:transcriptional regulator with XRE-family HTH domain